MFYFFFSNALKQRPQQADAPSGNYGIHVVLHSKEEMGPDNFKKIFQTYQKVVPNFVIPESLNNVENRLFADTFLVFDSLEKLKDFIVLFLKDCGEKCARLVAMTQYNQALQQSAHISQLAPNIHALSDEIINPEYKENTGLLKKIFR